uniref:Phosphoinositide phospholipase C n=1 Tax=Hemiscolopendra marginata TaxID=943146 RepID=A0A646QFE3_9MYRI
MNHHSVSQEMSAKETNHQAGNEKYSPERNISPRKPSALMNQIHNQIHKVGASNENINRIQSADDSNQPKNDGSLQKEGETSQQKIKKDAFTSILKWVEASKGGGKEEKKNKFRGKRVQQWLDSSRKKHAPTMLNVPTDEALIEKTMDVLREGSNLWKVKSISRCFRRRYIFDKDSKRIFCEGSRKPRCVSGDQIIEIREILDVRKGWKTDRFNKIALRLSHNKDKKPKIARLAEESFCFSIIYGPEHKALDLVCSDENVCNAWVRGLSHLTALQRSVERGQSFIGWLKRQFRNADVDKSGALNFDECLGLLNQLNIDMSRDHARKIFDQANTNKTKRKGEDVIDEEEFVLFYKLLVTRPEVEKAFNKYSGGTALWGATQLLAFLENDQKIQNITLDDAIDIIELYEPTEAKTEGFLSFDGFRKLILSDVMDIFNVNHRNVYHDMTKPISHYFIASSHNTYLMADQIAGESSVEGYIRALKNGCRCVELDLWDGPKDEPIIYHGYTLTSKILLKDVLQYAIKPYAFATSEYPVILSLENHLSVKQQDVLAKHFKNILGDMLYTTPVTSDMVELPSPTDLKGKIVIKGKKLPEKFSEKGLDARDQSVEEHGSASDEEDPVSNGNVEDKNKKTKVKLSPELSKLVNICAATHFKDFETSAKAGKVYHISSLSENDALRLASLSPNDFIDHNRRQLVRIYPGAIRQSSSNYDPIPFWNVGCQIVALNYQTRDFAMMVNEAKFQDNGECGYLLKPEFLRDDSISSRVRNKFNKKTLTLQILSGTCLPKPRRLSTGEIIDPYVIVDILGHPDDQKTFKTNYVHNNGFNPVWTETFKIEIQVPDLALVHFIVRDYTAMRSDEKIGEYCIPFNCMQQGYRVVHLRDEFNRSLFPATIFIHTTID